MTQTPTPAVQPPISIASWRTYRNTGCGYSFQYPNTWSQQGSESNSVNLQGTVMSRMVDFIDTASQGIQTSDGNNNQIYAPKDRMHVECYTMGATIYNYAMTEYNNAHGVYSQSKRKISIGGQTAIVGEIRNTATVTSGEHAGRIAIPSHRLYVHFMHKDQSRSLYFEFDTPLGAGDAAEIADFEQVLSTFRFD